MKDYKYAVFIGRFQPFHNAHLEVIKHGLQIADKVLIIVGSSHSANNIKNPFTFEERASLIKSSLSATDLNKVSIEPIRDYYYSDNVWVSNIQAITSKYFDESDSVALLGNYKDSSSYYINYFPQWDFMPIKSSTNLDATNIRATWLECPNQKTWEGFINEPASLLVLEQLVPKSVHTFLMNLQKSTRYANLCDEYKFVKDYREAWKNAPYAPTFVTTDTVVVCSGHVLVVKRKFNPGKGLYALPGGFVKPSEKIRSAAIRELKEETGIRLDKIILDSSIVDEHVFDHPNRSLRGRTVTHAYYIKLKDGKLPEIKGSDDAEVAFWLPINDVNKLEDRFYEDHNHIINYFINRT